MRFKGILLLGFLLTLFACGGAGEDVGVGSVSGLVLDLNGNPIRGARVFTVSGTPRGNVYNYGWLISTEWC